MGRLHLAAPTPAPCLSGRKGGEVEPPHSSPLVPVPACGGGYVPLWLHAHGLFSRLSVFAPHPGPWFPPSLSHERPIAPHPLGS